MQSEPGRWSERAERRLALRCTRLAEPVADPIFDTLAAQAARALGARAAAVVVHDGDRRWCLGRSGGIPPHWTTSQAPDGWTVVGCARLHLPSSPDLAVAELIVVSDRAPVTPSAQETLSAFASACDALLAERARAGEEDGVVGVVVVDANGVLVGATASIEELLGWSLRERIGQSALDLVDERDFGLAAETFARSTTFPGRRPPLELRIRHADGSFRLVEIVAENRTDDEGVIFLELATPMRFRSSSETVLRVSGILGLLGREVSLAAVAAACQQFVES